MTATFGKLEHETLTLQPGLNIIEAPNEWGKSTWSAFLLAMLYGLDTRVKTTKTALADKERFAPWSGSPMSGRIDLNWNGRDITVERFTKRRIPLGEFRAYETGTGLPVPELTAANCGQLLLGVEQSVFRRSGFIRHSDLPVTQDETLRRRLNALVTTGDDSGDADRLARQLKELKNRCRYNRSGLLPQAEAERDALDARLLELENLSLQSRKLRQRLDELKQWRTDLENHRAALNYAASRADARQVAQARDARDRGLQNLTRLEHTAASLPDPETARREADKLRAHIARWNDLQFQLQMLPPLPDVPQENPPFRGLTGDEALAQASKDAAEYDSVQKRTVRLPWLIVTAFSLVLCAVLLLMQTLWWVLPATVAVLFCAAGLTDSRSRRARLHHLEARYGSSDPEAWIASAREHAASLAAYRENTEAGKAARAELEAQLAALQRQRRELGRVAPEGGQDLQRTGVVISQRQLGGLLEQSVRFLLQLKGLIRLICGIHTGTVPLDQRHHDADEDHQGYGQDQKREVDLLEYLHFASGLAPGVGGARVPHRLVFHIQPCLSHSSSTLLY